MSNSSLISVIIPFYNSENYLGKCLESVVQQTYQNLEIILVNDGSTDSSSKIAHSFQEKDPRISVLSQANQGQGVARNYGISKANGDYVTFIDADDYVNHDYVEYLYNLLKMDNFKSPLAICSYTEIYTTNGKTINKGNSFQGTLTGEECLKRMFYDQQVNTCAYTKLIKRELLFPAPFFSNQTVYEDLASIYKLFLKAKTVACGFQSKYFYQIHDNSTLSKEFTPKKLIACQMIDNLSKQVINFYPELRYAAHASQVSIRLSLINQLMGLQQYSKELKTLTSFVRKNQIYVIFNKNYRYSKRIAVFALNFGIRFYYLLLRQYLGDHKV